MSSHARTRRAFSLVELLVVIGIIGVLIGLLLPAVQRVRESANRINCQNRLKQLGVALHNYHDHEGSFPAGYKCKVTSKPLDTAPGWGWASLLLPYLEQGAVSRQIDFNLPIEHSANQAARMTVLRVFICPSDRMTGLYTVRDQSNAPLTQAATNSYAACFGVGIDIDEELDDANGMFFRNSRVTFADIPDGASNTIAIGERASLFAQTPWAGAIQGSTVRVTPGAPVLNPNAVEEPTTGALAHTADHPLNDPMSDPEDFYTPHTGIGGFLFADGSVRPLRIGVPLAILQALSTRNGGETVNSADY